MTDTHTPEQPWWDAVLHDPDDHHPEHVALCRVLRDLYEQELTTTDEEMPAWESFVAWVRSDALDQEMYGEALHADPSLLDPLWAAYEAGWKARKCGTVVVRMTLEHAARLAQAVEKGAALPTLAPKREATA